MYRIGELAKATNTKVVTVRYYEKIGLLSEPERSEANYRTYNDGALKRLLFIRRCRDLGFSLDQVRELLILSSNKTQSCHKVDQLTSYHVKEIEDKISDLQKLATELRRISASCEGEHTISDCQIIEAMTRPGFLKDKPE